jgi:hypothetical protein
MSFLNHYFRKNHYFDRPFTHPNLIQIIQKPLDIFNYLDREHWLQSTFRFGGKTSEYGGFNVKKLDQIAKIISFKNMGSSQFEWGYVPSSFDYFLENFYCNKLNIFSFKLKNYPLDIHVICRKDITVKVKNFINKLSLCSGWDDLIKKELKLRELPYFKNSIEDFILKKENKNIGWLELSNPFAFFLDEQVFSHFIKLFQSNSLDYIIFD